MLKYLILFLLFALLLGQSCLPVVGARGSIKILEFSSINTYKFKLSVKGFSDIYWV